MLLAEFAPNKKVRHTHVKTSSNAGTLQGLVLSILLTCSHETGHLILGKLDLSILELGIILWQHFE